MLPSNCTPPFSTLSEKHRQDRESMIDALRENPNALEHASASLKSDLYVVVEAVRRDGHALRYANERMWLELVVVAEAVRQKKNDRDFVLEVVCRNGLALQYASKPLTKDKEIAAQAARQNVDALQFVHSALRADRCFMLPIVQLHGQALQHVHGLLKADKDFVLAAIRQDGLALRFASGLLKLDKQIAIEAIQQNCEALQYAHESLMRDGEVLKAAGLSAPASFINESRTRGNALPVVSNKTLASLTQVPDELIEEAAKLLSTGIVVAFTGAGISAESGVPTYRDPGGLWRTYDMRKVSSIKSFLNDPVSCWRFELELYKLLKGIEPNAGHCALAELESAGVLKGVVTQNVEGLHAQAGSKVVVELHGNETRALCLGCATTCDALSAFQSIGWVDEEGNIVESMLPSTTSILRKHPRRNSRVRRNVAKPRSSSESSSSSSSLSSAVDPLCLDEAIQESVLCPPIGAPNCSECGGLLKPAATYFGERVHPAVLKRAEWLFKICDVALVVGSNCSVAPANQLPLLVQKRGGKLIEVNPNASKLSSCVDLHLQGHAGEVLPRLVHAVSARLLSSGVGIDEDVRHNSKSSDEMVESLAVPRPALKNGRRRNSKKKQASCQAKVFMR